LIVHTRDRAVLVSWACPACVPILSQARDLLFLRRAGATAAQGPDSPVTCLLQSPDRIMTSEPHSQGMRGTGATTVIRREVSRSLTGQAQRLVARIAWPARKAGRLCRAGSAAERVGAGGT
jgi:hypothetical protein